MERYEPPAVTELGTVAQLTRGLPGVGGDDFFYVAALDNIVQIRLGDHDISH